MRTASCPAFSRFSRGRDDGMTYNFRWDEKDKLIDRFGADFFARLCAMLDKYTPAWGLTDISLIDYFSANALFTCRSAMYGDCVLKICVPWPEVLGELYALREYDGRGFCKLYEVDFDDFVLLVERIVPGETLWEVQVIAERVDVFASLFRGLHIAPANPAPYRTYSRWVSRMAEFMAAQADYAELTEYMAKAQAMYDKLEAKYTGKMLLHGDFHQENILRGAEGVYTIIDPKGVVGDPVFDIPRFVINEYDSGCAEAEKRAHTAETLRLLSAALGYPLADLAAAYAVEMTMANCWSVESGEEPDMPGVRLAHELYEEWMKI